jgi:hypothetical protein
MHADGKIAALPVFSALIATVFLGLGLGFTVCELKRLSAIREGHNRGAGRTGEDAGTEDEGGQQANERAERELVA